MPAPCAPYNPTHAAVGATFFLAVSVTLSTSITPAMNFRGLYIPSTCTVNVWGIDDTVVAFTNPQIGAILWVQGRALTLTGSVAAAIVGIR